MKLDWNKIVSNAVTVLVAAVFLGAASYLWKGVDTIDARIDKNVSSIRATQEVIAPKVDALEAAISLLVEHHEQLCVDLKQTNKTKLVFEFPDKGDTFNQIQVQQRSPHE